MTTQRLVSQLPYDAIPEMLPPPHTLTKKPLAGYTRELEMRPDAPFFNASIYCNRLNLRFSLWLRHPATIALIRSFGDYYREAAREARPDLIMQVKTGARCVHGYYVHVMLHDALSAWCDLMSLPQSEMPRIPVPQRSVVPTTTLVYTRRTVRTQSTTDAELSPADFLAQVISAARGGAF